MPKKTLSLSEWVDYFAGNGDKRKSSISEDEVEFGGNTIDELRRTVNSQYYTPKQAEENLAQTRWEFLSNIPGSGNVISAQDAYASALDAYKAYQGGDYRSAAISGGLAGLSGVGAVFGLPVGKFAKGAADAAHDSLYAIPAWHGSPHDFDKFDMRKMGSGEGTQNEGYGLYFSQSPDAAAFYKKKHDAIFGHTLNGQPVTNAIIDDWAGRKLQGEDLNKLLADNQSQAKYWHEMAKTLKGEEAEEALTRARWAQNDADAIAQVVNEDVGLLGSGVLYRTELDVEPEDLLDWNKPISEQSDKVQVALRKMWGNEKFDKLRNNQAKTITPIGQREAMAFQNAGIPGIRYSEHKPALGEYSNYVIFDDKLVKILSKE